ncbi:hypothetical protein [Rossellomorea marisflavi]|uniref:hypothetical protein n=1 Tax=Rossellomorea marisflavi TaxID=189381 RepID=UPI003511FA66
MNKKLLAQIILITIVVILAVLQLTDVIAIPNEVLSAVLGVALIILIVFKFYKAKQAEKSPRQ